MEGVQVHNYVLCTLRVDNQKGDTKNMLRSFLIYLSKATWARRVVTRWKIAWLVASRFIAGETREDAIRTICDLNSKGIWATLDHLGESVTDHDQARQAAEEIIQIPVSLSVSPKSPNKELQHHQTSLAFVSN